MIYFVNLATQTTEQIYFETRLCVCQFKYNNKRITKKQVKCFALLCIALFFLVIFTSSKTGS